MMNIATANIIIVKLGIIVKKKVVSYLRGDTNAASSTFL